MSLQFNIVKISCLSFMFKMSGCVTLSTKSSPHQLKESRPHWLESIKQCQKFDQNSTKKLKASFSMFRDSNFRGVCLWMLRSEMRLVLRYTWTGWTFLMTVAACCCFLNNYRYYSVETFTCYLCCIFIDNLTHKAAWPYLQIWISYSFLGSLG